MSIDWKKALGFGALVWIVMFVIISMCIAYGVPNGGTQLWNIIWTIISLILVFFAARYIGMMNYGVAFQYGLVFAVVGIILNYFISVKFVPEMFSSMYYWINYVLIVFVPMLTVKKNPGVV